MAAIKGPRKLRRYSAEFKLKAVQLSEQSGVLIRDVAESLCIHPFMLSKWKKDYREGTLKPAAEAAGLSLPKVLRPPQQDPRVRTLQRQVQ